MHNGHGEGKEPSCPTISINENELCHHALNIEEENTAIISEVTRGSVDCPLGALISLYLFLSFTFHLFVPWER